jgi:hypothetical protein
MPKLSDFVLAAAAAADEQHQQGAATEAAAHAAASPAAAATSAAAATTPSLPRYRDPKTGQLLPEGSPPPPRPRAHIQARREWRGLVRYCCTALDEAAAATAADGSGARPTTTTTTALPPDAGFSSSSEDDEGFEQEQGKNEVVHPLDDPSAPWAAHYAALLASVSLGEQQRRRER